MWHLRYETDEHVYETETESRRQTQWVVAKKEEVVWRDGVEGGVSRRKLLHENFHPRVVLEIHRRVAVTTCLQFSLLNL